MHDSSMPTLIGGALLRALFLAPACARNPGARLRGNDRPVGAPGRLRLALLALVALPVTGCCDEPDMMHDLDFSGTVQGTVLKEIRERSTTAEERCTDACRSIAEREGQGVPVSAPFCMATALSTTPPDPWDPSHLQVTIECTAHFVIRGTCD
jgi:hypothetical protein